MTLLFLASAWLAGTYLAVTFDVPAPPLVLFLLAALLLMVPFVASHRSVLPPALSVVLVLAMLRVASLGDGDVSALDPYHGRGDVEVEGVVVDDPEAAGSAMRLRLRVDRVRADDAWAEESGDALVTLMAPAQLARQRDAPLLRYGDRLLLEGALEAPPELQEFDYPTYLARQGIGSVMEFPTATLLDDGGGTAVRRWLYDARRDLADSLARVLPEPQSAVGQALLLGLRDGLDDEMLEDFRATGTSHVLAISGLHVGVVLGLGLAVSAWALGRRRQLYLLVPLLLIWAYALLTGMSPSATRAAIMGTVYLAALLVGRPRSALPALGLAAALMVAVDPNVLWSISFQLSFTAVTGIVLLGVPLYERMRAIVEERVPLEGASAWLFSAIAYPVAVGVAATVATIPLVAFYFQRVSLVGIPTTVAVLPALPLVLVSQAATGLIGLASTTLAEPAGWIAWASTAYVTGVVGVVSRLPVTAFDTGVLAPVLVWLYYGAFAAVLLRGTLRPLALRSAREASTFALAFPRIPAGVRWPLIVAVASVAALLWTAALTQRDRGLRVAFIDVGQGDAIFISTPGGRQVLIDGGPGPLDAVRFLGRAMPFRDRTIDMVVLTHAHSDHINGLIEVLDRYEVEEIVERRVEYVSTSYEAWRRAVEREGARVTEALAGQLISLGDGAYLEVFSPADRLLRGTSSDVNNASVAMRLVYGEVSFFLSGDMFSEAEGALFARQGSIDSDVLKVAHHGSRTSSRRDFIEAVSPAVAVISVGADNRFGHPHA